MEPVGTPAGPVNRPDSSGAAASGRRAAVEPGRARGRYFADRLLRHANERIKLQMKLGAHNPDRSHRRRAFTLVESLFAMTMASVMFAALYSGLAFGFSIIKAARENSRAT